MGRLPAGLSISIIIAAVSIAFVFGFWQLEWPVGQGLPLLVHLCSALCLFWGTARYLLCGFISESTERSVGRDAQAVLQVAATVTGLVAGIIILYAVVMESLLRTACYRHEETYQAHIWPSGFIDLAFLCLAALLCRRDSKDGRLITVVFWLLAIGCLWGAFQIPAYREVTTSGGSRYAVATDWTFPVMMGWAVIIAAFTGIEGMKIRRRRMLAWPDHLEWLTEPMRCWPGFRYSAGMLAAGVLLLGSLHVINPWTSVAGFLTAIAMLALTNRMWNENLGDMGLALITLAVVSLFMIHLPDRQWQPIDFAMVYTRALIGLAVMTWFWPWLAAVWDQQLDNGRAWTTTGLLIQVANRVGFLVALAGFLISLYLFIWPKLPYAFSFEITWGLVGNLLLVLALFSGVKRTGQPGLAWLALATIGSTAGFLLLRLPHSAVGQWWSLNWPTGLSIAALIAILLNALVARTKKWRVLAEPLYLTGIFLLPILAITGVTFTLPVRMPSWGPSSTFGVLMVVYVLTAFLAGPRSFVAVAAICAVMAGWGLHEITGITIIPFWFFFGILTGVVLFALAYIFEDRLQLRTVRLFKWAGALIALVSLVTGYFAANI